MDGEYHKSFLTALQLAVALYETYVANSEEYGHVIKSNNCIFFLVPRHGLACIRSVGSGSGVTVQALGSLIGGHGGQYSNQTMQEDTKTVSRLDGPNLQPNGMIKLVLKVITIFARSLLCNNMQFNSSLWAGLFVIQTVGESMFTHLDFHISDWLKDTCDQSYTSD